MTLLTFPLPVVESVTNVRLEKKLQQKLDHKTKPVGALGRLEDLAMQLGLIQRSDVITFTDPQMLVFAADHGIASEGVSAYPQSVTTQMVTNMLTGGAAINVLARQHGFALHVVDAGVAGDLEPHPQLIRRKIARGTQNMCVGPAMTPEQLNSAVQAGINIVARLPGNVVALGEMGIANTSSAALLLHRLAGVPIAEATGRGTGLNDGQLLHKQQVLKVASSCHPDAADPLEVLAALGGFEIAMMVGAMLQAAPERRLVLVDGFIAGSAALVAHHLTPHVQHYMVYSHRSGEQGHKKMLQFLKARPLLDLGLRLGEGTGALLAWPLVVSTGRLMNEMASFASAGVSGKSDDAQAEPSAYAPSAPQPLASKL
ncbi:MAG: nicotinate-nucleotide--dimethylbenzimidazole phosphoribosyltransferase [Chitinophagaceae bacterium]|nr:nicotinate-nucleotide--dimethylbenzimidazole phosphoribosyltransferase [Polaromonas sp.]